LPDHQNKSDVGAALVRRWFDSDGVDAIVDVSISSVALAVWQIVKEKNKVFLIASAGTSDLTAKPARQTMCIGHTTPGHSQTGRHTP
jgi:branched-chain amino acid transport system substrate-binding protein